MPGSGPTLAGHSLPPRALRGGARLRLCSNGPLANSRYPMNASLPPRRRALPRPCLSLAGLLLAACSSAPAEQSAQPPPAPIAPGCTSDSQCTPYHVCSAGACVALLDPPAHLQATPGTGVVDLSWDPRPGATSYVVSAATTEAPPKWTKLGEGQGTGAHIFNIPDDTTVYLDAHVLDGNGTDLGHATLPAFGGSCPQPLTESIRIMYADLSQSRIHVTAGTPLRLQLRFVGPSAAFANAGITADAYPGEFTALRAP